ncbi:MAG: WYL domain-containing protein [Acidimicrobiia bacterium]
MGRVLERLLNLLAFLRTVDRPVTIDEIRYTVAGYDRDNDQAFRRMFERDKGLLRGAGIPLETVVIDEITQRLGYVLPSERFEMADPGLTDEERAALAVAARMVRMGGDDIRPAIQKLGGTDDAGDGDPRWSANLPGDHDDVAELFDAVAGRREVTVTYRDRPRRLQPLGLLHRRGHWYLVALESGDQRIYRVDRGEGWTAVGDAEVFERPAGLDIGSALPAHPWEAGEEPVTATVHFDDDIAWWVRRRLPDDALSIVDGRLVAELEVAHREAFLGWLLDLGPSAEVLGPPELRAAVIDRIRGVA